MGKGKPRHNPDKHQNKRGGFCQWYEEYSSGQAVELDNSLNEMWDLYLRGARSQIVEYNKQVAEIKRYGYKVLRNSVGLHKLILNR